MSFKVGDRVVCIETNPLKMINTNRTEEIFNGKVYEISEGNHVTFGGYINVSVKGLVTKWIADSFRKVDEDSTSNFKSNALSKQLAQKAADYNPMELPEHLTVDQ